MAVKSFSTKEVLEIVMDFGLFFLFFFFVSTDCTH